MADLIQLLAISLAATIALCILQPRWDTGGGALLIFSLGIPALPFILPLFVGICALYLVWMLLYIFIIAPIMWAVKRIRA